MPGVGASDEAWAARWAAREGLLALAEKLETQGAARGAALVREAAVFRRSAIAVCLAASQNTPCSKAASRAYFRFSHGVRTLVVQLEA